MYFLLIIYLLFGILYIYSVSMNKKTHESFINKKCSTNKLTHLKCNSNLIAKSINRIKKKYEVLENKLSQINLI